MCRPVMAGTRTTPTVRATDCANGGFKLGGAGFVNLSAEYDDDLQTSRGVTRPVAVAFAQKT